MRDTENRSRGTKDGDGEHTIQFEAFAVTFKQALYRVLRLGERK